MKLPGGIVGPHLEGRLRRGTVVRFELQQLKDPLRQGQARMKFGIILNAIVGDDEIFLALTTSQMHAFKDGRWENDILRLSVGQYSFFQKETVVNLRQVELIPIEKLRQLAEAEKLTIEGNLAAADMTRIDGILRASRLISPRILKRILV